jgi:hypothetical protein
LRGGDPAVPDKHKHTTAMQQHHLQYRCLLLFILFSVCLPAYSFAGTKIYEVRNGEVRFWSEAPKELISASSRKLQGVLDAEKMIFAFKINITSFMGFNSPLQRDHFNENYMESRNFPDAVFKGKIIESVDLSKDGTYQVRAKGKLSIHGIEQERIIKVQMVIKNAKCQVFSTFPIQLSDHDIKIPRIVDDKLSPEIKVSVRALLQPQSRS